jgi:hypothetical protein
VGLRGTAHRKAPGCPGTVLAVRAGEVNEYLLNLNHGLSEIYPECLTWPECSRQHLLASQAAARIRYLGA